MLKQKDEKKKEFNNTDVRIVLGCCCVVKVTAGGKPNHELVNVDKLELTSLTSFGVGNVLGVLLQNERKYAFTRIRCLCPCLCACVSAHVCVERETQTLYLHEQSHTHLLLSLTNIQSENNYYQN